MVVNKEPVVTLTEFDTLCLSAATIDLLPKSSPQATAGAAGSEWRGPGVTGNIFDPSSIITPTATKPFYGPYFFKNYYIDPTTTCTTIDSIDVVMQARPTLTITTPLPAEACEGEDFQLDVVAERTYSGIKWRTIGDGMFDDSSLINPIYTPGLNDQLIYGTSLSVTSNQPAILRNCPAATANIDLAIHAYPVFTYGNRDSGCAPITVDFFDTVTRPTNYPVTYLWDFGNGITSTDEDPVGIVFDKAGYYNVILTVTNTAGLGNCAVTDTMQLVDVYPVPVASFVSNPDYYTTIALPKFEFTSTSTVATGSIVKYDWDFGNGFTDTVANAVHRYGEDTAVYVVTHTVTTDKGCVDDTTKLIKIGPDITVFIPSAFSPDGAGPGRNNKFFVVAQGYIGYNLKIYNRWGEMLFESHDPEKEPWDGTYQNQPAQQDVYMYVAKVIAFDNQEYSYTGTVTLLR
jgi:gliding motility-associated-like protein